MGISDGADEGKAEAVALGVAAFDEALEDAGEEIGGETGTIVFDGNAGGGSRGDGDGNVGVGACVAQLVLHEVGEQAGAEGEVREDADGTGAATVSCWWRSAKAGA